MLWSPAPAPTGTFIHYKGTAKYDTFHILQKS